MLSIFSCAYWPFIYYLENVYSSSLSILSCFFLFVIQLCFLCILDIRFLPDIWYLVWYMISGTPNTWYMYLIYIWYLVHQIHDIFHGVGTLLTFLTLLFVAQEFLILITSNLSIHVKPQRPPKSQNNLEKEQSSRLHTYRFQNVL